MPKFRSELLHIILVAMPLLALASPAVAAPFGDRPFGLVISDLANLDFNAGYDAVQAKALAGDASAMYRLGCYHCSSALSTATPPAVQADGLAWLRKAGQAGDGRGFITLGSYYACGWQGYPHDDQAALAAFKAAASLKYPAGSALAGYMAEHGQGMTADPALALAWYQEAAERGNALAMGCLAAMFEDGRGTAPDPAKAAKLYEQALQDPRWGTEAASRLGMLYARGIGGKRDVVKALALLEPLRGNREAALQAGLIYDRGEGIPRDAVRAASFYYESMDLPLAKLGLARLYAKGEAVEHSPKEALRLAKEAADAGLVEAQALAGELLGGATDAVKGFQMLAYAQARGDRSAGPLRLALQQRMPAEQLAVAASEVAETLEMHPPEGVKETPAYGPDGKVERPAWFGYALLAAQAGNSKAMLRLARAYNYMPGYPSDMAQAGKWSLLAYRSGNKEAADTLALAYQARPIADALPELTALAEGGNARAQGILGYAFCHGNMGVELNRPTAFRWSYMAAKGGDGTGALTAASLALNGKDVPKDPARARECYEIAATHGVSHAMYFLGQLAETPADAYAYFAMGADSDQMCLKAATDLRPKLDPAQLVQSRARVAGFLAKYGGVPSPSGKMVPMKVQI
ncbi:MAG: hypothetical protein JWM80_6477 [Cyanobacteria bacterium RYN_339]|nr:hypothetical protein [Cyanobacteria bacterium RYN_339]